MVEHVSLVTLATLTTPALVSHHLQEETAVSFIAYIVLNNYGKRLDV